MPIMTAVREVLTGTITPDSEGQQGSPSLIQKKVNLEPGYRYTVKNVQVFNDRARTKPAATTGPSGEALFSQLVYATPYPITLNNESHGYSALSNTFFDRSGPFAGDSTVLYKSVTCSTDSEAAGLNSAEVFFQEFPDPTVQTVTANAFYTPHIYLTCIHQSFEAQATQVTLSFYIEVIKTKCSVLEQTMGQYKELLEAQCRLLTDTANSIKPTGTAAGRSFPTWQYGGIRPEIMVTSANALRYYNKLASRAYQDMDPITGFQTRFKESTKMVDFDKAFGDTTTNIPDWISLMDVSGVTSGIIRPYPPPVKFSGNGNTVMYDKDGQPASVVT